MIRDGNFLYVDKTKYIYELLRKPKGDFFLSRPRRFGKTLLLGTLRELFEGGRGRFEGLWINDESDYAFPRHPVVSLSLSFDSTGPDALQEKILRALELIAGETTGPRPASISGSSSRPFIDATTPRSWCSSTSTTPR